MNAEKGPEGGGYQRVIEDILKKKHVPLKHEITLTDCFDIIDKYFNNNKNKQEDLREATIYSVRSFIKREIGSREPIIRGFVEIAKGDKLSLAITPDQIHAFVFAFNMNMKSDVSFYASVESVDEKPKKVRVVPLKYIDVATRFTNNLIISKGLAQRLGVKKGQEIKVTNIYQKTSNINLDRY